ncbi:restriction endonuclease subunit S [Chryseobacterium gallinarum]|uniref:restriction endonuclease subunit S n=2 Tax=Chryseobacterium TaxID=59732 RepID=UPI0020243197|nr:restriction endonuclease subunit S [Chryseobacterium gallinarum]MCL8538670.1 restriction endonuclease subunit S [Chryseobacterium gallinarum]
MSYRKIGDLIQLVDHRNKDLSVTYLVGLTINKKFIPSVANIIGTDMSNYKLIRKNQFACSTMQVRRDKKMPIALLKNVDIAIISQAYPVFEIRDENEILPDYLMLWFSRPEFDREACFHAVGGVRGSLEWEDFCGMELPVPSIEEQNKIITQYQSIENKIKVNEQICEKLEATAQALYYNMVEENQCKESILKDLCSFQEGYVNPSQEYPKYFDGNIKWLRANDVNGGFILNTSRTLTEEGFNSAGTSALLFSPQTIVITKSGTIGRLGILCDYMCGNRAVINIKPNEECNLPFIFFVLKTKYNELIDMAVGSAQANLYVPILASLKIKIPGKEVLNHFNLVGNNLLELIKFKTQENQKLTQLQSLLLSRLAVEKKLENVL